MQFIYHTDKLTQKPIRQEKRVQKLNDTKRGRWRELLVLRYGSRFISRETGIVTRRHAIRATLCFHGNDRRSYTSAWVQKLFREDGFLTTFCYADRVRLLSCLRSYACTYLSNAGDVSNAGINNDQEQQLRLRSYVRIITMCKMQLSICDIVNVNQKIYGHSTCFSIVARCVRMILSRYASRFRTSDEDSTTVRQDLINVRSTLTRFEVLDVLFHDFFEGRTQQFYDLRILYTSNSTVTLQRACITKN